MQPGPQPGPFVPPPVVARHEVRPRAWWFVVAGGLALAGIVGAIVIWVVGVTRITDTIDGFTRIDVPGSGEVAIDEPGGYSIYDEGPGASDGRSSSPGVTVTDPSGGEVTLRRYTSSVTYEDFGGHEGRGLYTFRAEEAGTYTVTTTGESSSEIAVGRGIGRGLVGWIVGGFVVGFVGVAAGIIMAIVTGVRRGRSRRMLAAGRMPAPAPPGGWGAPPNAGWGPPPGPPPGGGWAG